LAYERDVITSVNIFLTQHRGDAQVRTGPDVTGSEDARHAGLEHEWIVVGIVDNCSGIPPEVLPRIFDLFFTTKLPGHGTGLVLEITRRFLRRFYGDIDIQSRPGRTECRVRMVAEKPSAPGVGASREAS
jgi:signal transduction histidine kinase